MFKRYQRKGFTEARLVTDEEIADRTLLLKAGVLISSQDLIKGSPKHGDMIARNPNNHTDQWLIAADYWIRNFEQKPML